MTKNEELITQYIAEVEEDTQINMLNLRDMQMTLPSIKHKWASRMIKAKIKIKKNNNLLDKAREKILEQQSKNQNIGLSKSAMMNKIDENPVIIKIKNDTEELRMIVEYLEKVEKILSSVTYDIRNLTEIMKLETL